MSSAMPIAFDRKRKDVEFDNDAENDPMLQRRSGIKGVRREFNVAESTQEAQFHPLPQELNLQLLANMGYNFSTTQQHADYRNQIINNGKSNQSPSSSSTSDNFPSTPLDDVSVESYFTKGSSTQSESCHSASYPDFDFYPGYICPRPPGLLGMQMAQSKSAHSFDSDADADGMEVDSEQTDEDAPLHGDHCKSIPQLLCRGSGPCKELWAHCRDCGTMSQVDCPPLPKPLAFSP